MAVSHTPHGAILIRSNAEFTAVNGVVGGHGTPDDPYLISGWEITNVDTTEAIFIRDTDASFVIRDVYVHQPRVSVSRASVSSRSRTDGSRTPRSPGSPGICPWSSRATSPWPETT